MDHPCRPQLVPKSARRTKSRCAAQVPLCLSDLPTRTSEKLSCPERNLRFGLHSECEHVLVDVERFGVVAGRSGRADLEVGRPSPNRAPASCGFGPHRVPPQVLQDGDDRRGGPELRPSRFGISVEVPPPREKVLALQVLSLPIPLSSSEGQSGQYLPSPPHRFWYNGDMSSSRRHRASNGFRLILPLSILGIAVVVATVLQPHWLTIALLLALVGVGAGRSLLREERWRPADDLTTLRLGLFLVFTALALGSVGFSWPAVTVGAAALLLDVCDGYVARRTTPTSAGSGFDESVDALGVLILAVALVPVWGWWVVLPGTFYYVFRAAILLRPAWRRQLPASFLRKTIAASQGVLLLTAGSPLALAIPWIGFACAATALAALVFSFGRDVLWLERRARDEYQMHHIEPLQISSEPARVRRDRKARKMLPERRLGQ